MERLEVLDLRRTTITTWLGKGGTAKGGISLYTAHAIPENAFMNYEVRLREVWLPQHVSVIEKQAFAGCANLRLLVCSDPKAPNLFQGALNDSLTVVFVPAGSAGHYKSQKRWAPFNILEGEPTRLALTVSSNTPLSAEILRTGHQPADIHYLSITGALSEEDFVLIRDLMPNLVAIDLHAVQATALPDYTFSQKRYLTEIILPDNLQRIGTRAFSGCTRLAGDLILPPQLQALGEGAFLDCDRLKRVLVTGNQLTEVGDNLFRNPISKLTYLPK
jgi:hypothetical protein